MWATDAGSDHTIAIKREDGGPGRSLHNDYVIHRRILETLLSAHSVFLIPACYRYISSQDQWWKDQFQHFSRAFQVPCNSLITERIPAFPQDIRNKIIDLYCPESLRSSIKKSEPDQDCLIRPYLGRRRLGVSRQSRFKAFSLRNYPLHLDQLEDLYLDTPHYARVMAETLAQLYWKSNVDANDIEFVLAPSKGAQSSSSGVSSFLGDHDVWILDFDCCRPIAMDETGVRQAVRAYYRNDPFYPRPGRQSVADQKLWNEFKDTFARASRTILPQERPEESLATLWLRLVEE